MHSGANTAIFPFANPFFLPIDPHPPNNISNMSISGQTRVEPIPILILSIGIGIGISLHPCIGIGISKNLQTYIVRECAQIT